MKKHFLKTTLGLMGMMGTLSIGVVNANNELIVHNIENGTITVYSQDKSYGITIQDKNLGATEVFNGDINRQNTASYGYYFQRGNNHGNYAGTNTGTPNELLEANVNDRINKGYSGDNDKFIIFTDGNKNTDDYRSGVYYTNETDNSYVGESPYNNLWGGGNDNNEQENIVKGYDKVNHMATNVDNRQGPCPIGYHVPSIGEWQELMILRCGANPDVCSGGVTRTPPGDSVWSSNRLKTYGNGKGFSNDLLLPRAGNRTDFNGKVFGRGEFGYYWSSSPRGEPYPTNVFIMYFERREKFITSFDRTYGGSIRCFKNFYVKLPKTKSDDTENTSLVIDVTAERVSAQNYSEEFQQAYKFAKGHGITTMPTIQKADMDGKLTRIAMAKMLSQYAINVLGQKPSNVEVPKFNDVTDKQNSDYDNGVILAYQLGIMGQNMPNNKFRPNDEVTRAEFATALSRMIYGTSDGEYKGTGKYYIHHMEKLVTEGIITKDDPNMKELRGYVMIMLMRSAK